MAGLSKWAVMAMLGLTVAAIPAASVSRADDGVGDSFTAAIPPAGQGSIEGKFDSLSAGNRKIALALFDAQDGSIGSDVALALDEIAAAKSSGTAWSELFEQMRADGLIDQPNMGAVISVAVQKWNSRAPATSDRNGAPTSRRGAYKALSTADHEIAGLLFERQSIGPTGQHAWSLDQIATARQNGVRWAEVMKRMRGDGLIGARTLDQVIRRHARHVESGAPSRKVIVTNGKGRQVVLTTRSRSGNN